VHLVGFITKKTVHYFLTAYVLPLPTFTGENSFHFT